MEITTTTIWMFGIIAMMILFGVCAAIFDNLGKKRENQQ